MSQESNERRINRCGYSVTVRGQSTDNSLEVLVDGRWVRPCDALARAVALADNGTPEPQTAADRLREQAHVFGDPSGAIARKIKALVTARGERVVPYRRSTSGSYQWGLVDVVTGEEVEGEPEQFHHRELGRMIEFRPVCFKSKRTAKQHAEWVNERLTGGRRQGRSEG
jgi:hypothetical protein